MRPTAELVRTENWCDDCNAVIFCGEAERTELYYPLLEHFERRPALPQLTAPVSGFALAQARSKPRSLRPGKRAWQSARKSRLGFGARSKDRFVAVTRYSRHCVSATAVRLAKGLLTLAAGPARGALIGLCRH